VRPPTSRLPKLGRALAAATLALFVLAAPAGAAGLGPDAGHSGGADSIRTAYWVMFVVAFAIGIPLLVGLIVAVRRFRSTGDAEPRRVTAGRGVMTRVGGGFALLAVAIFVFGVVMTRDARDADADASGEPIDIAVVGQQWLWRFEYPRAPDVAASPGIATVFSYNELVVPVDTTVNLSIDSTDVIHRWFIPALGGQVDAVPGEIAQTSFRADEEGVYEGQSTEFSGTGYPAMRAQVRVVSADEYEQYVQELGDDLAEAQSEVQAAVAEGTDQ
jgi:cytochrome c oxidase subunit II